MSSVLVQGRRTFFIQRLRVIIDNNRFKDIDSLGITTINK